MHGETGRRNREETNDGSHALGFGPLVSSSSYPPFCDDGIMSLRRVSCLCYQVLQLTPYKYRNISRCRFCTASKPPLNPFPKMCLEGDLQGLKLSQKGSPTITYYPSLLEVDIIVSLGGDVSSSNSTSAVTMMGTTSSQSLDSVVWIMSAMYHEFISWTFVPSVGLLHPGTE